MNNTLRVDDLYAPVEHPISAPERRGQKYRIQTGLADGLEVETSVPATPGFLEALEQLRELKVLPQGWDSYSANVIDPAVFRPALALIIESIQRCNAPRIMGSSGGGVILIWESEKKELSIEVLPEGGYEVYGCNEETGEEFDPDRPLTAAETKAALSTYCRT